MNGLSRQDRNELLKKWHWSPEEDLCHDVWAPSDTPRPWPSEVPKPKVELPDWCAQRAHLYIAAITKVYPTQMRAYLGDPMYARFCACWSEGPAQWSLEERLKFSLRAI